MSSRARLGLGVAGLGATALAIIFLLVPRGRLTAILPEKQASPSGSSPTATEPGLDFQHPSARESSPVVAPDEQAPVPRSPLEVLALFEEVREWTSVDDLLDPRLEGSNLARLRQLVVESGLTADELLGALQAVGDHDGRRVSLVLSFAWAGSVLEGHLNWLKEEALSPGSPLSDLKPTSDRRSTLSALAAMHALRLQHASEHLAGITKTLLSQDAEGAPAAGLRANAIRIALMGIEELDEDDAQSLMESLLATDLLDIPLANPWAVASRLGGSEWAARAVGEASNGNGLAAQGIASLQDPVFLGNLSYLIEKPQKTVYEKHLARSAARALLTIGTSEALQMLDGYLRNEETRGAALQALSSFEASQLENPVAAGELLLLGESFAGDHAVVSAVRTNVGTCLERARKGLLPEPDRDLLRASLRRALGSLRPTSPQFRFALESLLSLNDGRDAETLAAAASQLEDPALLRQIDRLRRRE